MRSFAAPDTKFCLERSETPPTVDGLAIGEPTGVVVCLACGESNENIDEIPHAPYCSQRFVHSQWYVESTLND